MRGGNSWWEFNYRRLASYFAENVGVYPKCFATTRDGKFLISGGHWDSSVRIASTETGKTVDVVHGHYDVVTCIGMSEDGNVLITGSRDTTIVPWQIIYGPGEICSLKRYPRAVFCGHDDEITSVAVNVEYDIVLSGSKDGTCVLHSLQDGRYLRTIRPKTSFEGVIVYSVMATAQSYILVHSITSIEVYFHMR